MFCFYSFAFNKTLHCRAFELALENFYKNLYSILSGCVSVLVDVVMIITSDNDKDIGSLRGPGGATCDIVTHDTLHPGGGGHRPRTEVEVIREQVSSDSSLT